MADKFIPSGWNEDRVVTGLTKAMTFGMPTRTEDRATFYLPSKIDTTDADAEGVPWNPGTKRKVTHKAVQAVCVIEFLDKATVSESFGEVQPDEIVITFLDAEWQKVNTFEYVVAGGDRYYRGTVEPPVALGTIDVWTIHAKTMDER